MREIINSIRLIVLKNRVWLLLLIILVLTISISYKIQEVARLENDIINGLLYIEDRVSYYTASKEKIMERKNQGISGEDIEKIKKYIDENKDNSHEEWYEIDENTNETIFKDKYSEIVPFHTDQASYLLSRYGYFEDEQKYYKEEESSDSYSFRNSDIEIEMAMDVKEFDGAKLVVGDGVGIFLLISLFLGFLLSSVEYLTPFYEFMRGLPWIREKTYLARVLLGMVMIFILLLLSTILSYFMVNRHSISEVMNYSNVCKLLLRYWIQVSVLYIFILTVGNLSGNILGHMGLLIILGMPYYVLSFNLNCIADVFGNSIFRKLEEFYSELPSMVQFLINPIMVFQNEEIIYYIIWGAFFLIIGLIVQNQYDGSRITNLVQGKALSKVAMVLAIFTTASIMQNIFHSIMYLYGVILFLTYCIFLFISYQFYKRVFAVQIGI